MTVAKFYDYMYDLTDDCFPLIVELKNKEGQIRVDVVYYCQEDDLYLWTNYYDDSEEVLCWVSAKEAIERFYDDSYSDS